MVYSFALSQFFLLCRCSLTSTLQKPCTCFALFSVSGTLHCYRCKNSASAFPPQLPLLHIFDPAGVYGEKLPQCCLPPRPKVLKNLKGVKLGWQKTCGAVVRLLFLLSFSTFTTTLTISFFVFFLTNTYNKKIKVIIFAP